METTAIQPTVEQVWEWLNEVYDPEIPVISVVDLGIVRDVRWQDKADDRELVVTITPTYSGCPATQVIASDIESALRSRGIERLRMETKLSPPWTTDWISELGRERLRNYGIAPPAQRSVDIAVLTRSRRHKPSVECPHCRSVNTVMVSQFGSTPCKALYKCQDCLEPFDYFKCL